MNQSFQKLFKNLLILVVLIFFVFEVLNESESILSSVDFAFNLWLKNVFPSLFPFFVLSSLLISYGFVDIISELFKPITNFLFKANNNASFIFIMGLITGIPSNAKNICELYKQNKINEKEASKILMFTFFPNPLFILGTVSIIFLNNKSAGILILLTNYITNILIGIMFRNYNSSKNNSKIDLKVFNNKRISNSFGNIITNSLVNSINTLLLILGVITMFSIITTIIDNNINLNNFYQSILNGFIEMTQGLKYISILDIPLKLKTTLSAMIISFGGLSTHLQIISILSDTKIKYLPFLTARVIQTILSGLIIFFTFDFWINLL